MMLTPEDLALARELLAKVREITAPKLSENVRPGELPEVLECSRCTSWKITKDPTFPAPIQLTERIKLWNRQAVLEWKEARRASARPLVAAQVKENPGPQGPGARSRLDLTATPRGKRGIEDHSDARQYSAPQRRASRSRTV
jgi:predicted DNA-binding transcriptional regulator AlpA